MIINQSLVLAIREYADQKEIARSIKDHYQEEVLKQKLQQTDREFQ